jgi:hypothetical protein
MLFNTQFESHAGNGWLRIFEFLNDRRSVRVRTFSPLYGLERTDAVNQFVIELSQVPPVCDFDQNQGCELTDLNLMLVEGNLLAGISVSPANAQFDLTGDGEINTADLDLWLELAALDNGLTLPYLRGDADLDGVVDGQDFIAWNQHKFSAVMRWDQGDFNGDGVVDGQDFVAWNANKFRSSLVTTIPEPSGASLANWLACSVVVFCWRRGVFLRARKRRALE